MRRDKAGKGQATKTSPTDASSDTQGAEAAGLAVLGAQGTQGEGKGTTAITGSQGAHAPAARPSYPSHTRTNALSSWPLQTKATKSLQPGHNTGAGPSNATAARQNRRAADKVCHCDK